MAFKDESETGTGGGLAGALRSGISAVASVVDVFVLRNIQAKGIARFIPKAAIEAGLSAKQVGQLIQVLTGVWVWSVPVLY